MGRNGVRASNPIDRLAARMVLDRLGRLRRSSLVVRLPDGTTRRVGAGEDDRPAQTVTVNDWSAFRRMVLGGDVGLGEAFMDGLWDADNLVGLLTLGATERRRLQLDSQWLSAIAATRMRVQNFARKPRTPRASARNVEAHYDHGNDFYRLWLDESMTYSCAFFASEDDTIEQAQRNKHLMLAEKAGLCSGHQVLDLGCGWGAFTRLAAAEFGADVTGITLSKQQRDEARARIESDGLGERARIELQDYREVEGTFDRIVSIGMFEHVGAEYWEPFFRRCRALLRPGGRMALQTITVPDSALRAHLSRPGWIQRYIFPGAALPSVAAIEGAATRAGLRLRHVEDIGPHYATTLRHWRERFLASLPAVRALGYDERFIRQWHYYLCLSEAGFRAGVTSDVQVVLDR